MADNEGSEQGGGGWGSWGFSNLSLSSLVNTVKETSQSIIQAYKEDLGDFSQTISKDTNEVLESKVKQSEGLLTNLIGMKGEEKASANPGTLSVASLQADISTYTVEPADKEDFETFCSTFKADQKTDEISQLLQSNEKMRALHSKLVPVVVSYHVFWSRYFYKMSKFEARERKRAELLKRAEAAVTQDAGGEDDFDWGGEDDEEDGKGESKGEEDKKEEGVNGEAAKEARKEAGEEEDRKEDDEGGAKGEVGSADQTGALEEGAGPASQAQDESPLEGVQEESPLEGVQAVPAIDPPTPATAAVEAPEARAQAVTAVADDQTGSPAPAQASAGGDSGAAADNAEDEGWDEWE